MKNSIINGAPDWVYEEEFALVKAYEWSNDSKCLAYYKFDESLVKEFSFPLYGSLYPENYVYKYPKAGEDNAKVNVFIYHVADGKQVAVKAEADHEYIPRIKWVPSNDMLSVQFMNRLQNYISLELVDRNTGLSITLHQDQSDTYLEVQDAYFLKNKRAFLWTSENSGFNHIYYYEFDERNSKEIGATLITKKMALNDGEDVVTNIIGVNEEKNTVLYTFADKYNPTDRLTIRKSLDPSAMEPPMPLPVPSGFTRVEPSVGFKYYVVYSSSVITPTIVTIHNEEGHPVRALEENRALQDTLKNYHIVFKQFFKFKNRNGDELVGWMIKPPNFDPVKKYPVLMYVYGGPGSQTCINAWGGANDMWFQMLAAKGYIVASVDNRGTGGRSEAFRTCTYGQLGKLETEDQIDAAKHFGRMNFVDESRIGIWGWSYGGYMSTLCLEKGADVFKMAIAVAPVTNWRYYDSIYTERYMGLPDLNGESYDENSPINHVDMIKGKFLLVHGTADDNVHFQNSAELVDAMVKNNVQFDMAMYPNKNHGIYGGNTRYHLFSKMTSFIFENL
jgi:dipeptidyl-peptidase-4